MHAPGQQYLKKITNLNWEMAKVKKKEKNEQAK